MALKSENAQFLLLWPKLSKKAFKNPLALLTKMKKSFEFHQDLYEIPQFYNYLEPLKYNFAMR